MNRHCVIGDYGGSIDYAARLKEPGQSYGIFSRETTCFTSGFAAPKIAARAIMYSIFDYRADIWSLRVLMYDLICPEHCVWPPKTRRPEDMVDYPAMGLYPEEMCDRMLKAKAPDLVARLVLWVSA